MPRALLTVPAVVELLRPALAAALVGAGPAVLPIGDDARLLPAMRPDLPVDDDVALVVPTSGSTGEPKGVLLTAEALRASAQATAARLGGDGSWLLAIPPTHIGGLQVLVRSLLADTEPVVCLGADPAAFTAASRGLTGRRYVSLVPTQLRRLLDGAAPALAGFDAVLLGGAAADEALLTRAAGEGVHVVTTYGMSETSGGCVYDGRPLDGVQVALEPDGRVVLAGPVVASGYRLQADAALADVDGARRFRTSDLGRWAPDGRLEVLGRADDVIVTGGANVAPVAVEAALRSHPLVTDAAVVGVPDAQWGRRVVAVVVPAGAPPSLAALRDHVGELLPRPWAPRELRLVGALPTLPGGKIDRLALRSHLDDPRPEQGT